MAHITHRQTRSGADRWRVQYRHGGRGTRQVVKTFDTQDSATRFAKLIEAVGAQAAEGIVTGPSSPLERSVAQQVAHHIEHLPRISQGTRSDYLKHAQDIEAYLGDVPLSALTRDMVTSFVMKLSAERGLAPKSIKHRQSLLSAALKSAVRADLLARNVAEGVEIPKPRLEDLHEMVTLTVPEVEALLRMVPARWVPLVATLVGTGIRIGEATALQVRDVDVKAKTIRVRQAWKHTDGNGHELGLPKSTVRRTVHAGGLVAVLEPLLGRDRDAWLFTNAVGGPVRPRTFHSAQWTPLMRAWAGSGGERLRVHDLRHTYASIKLAEGKSLAWLQKQLGHRDISTTVGTYGHLDVSGLSGLGDVVEWSRLLPSGP